MKMIQITVIWGVLVLALGLGCSAITDFPEMPEDSEAPIDNPTDDDTGTTETDAPSELYSIDDNLDNPVVITLEDDSTATFTMRFEAGLPEPEQGDDALEDLLGDIITLDVQNSDGISVTLSDGTLVTSPPDDEGEWGISLGNTDRTEVDVVFYNLFDSRSMQDGDEYTALIEIAANDYFEEESLTRDVTVTN